MKRWIAHISAIGGGGIVAALLLIGVNEGAFTALFDTLTGTATTTVSSVTTPLRRVESYIPTTTGTGSGSGTSTASATVSTETANWAGYVASGGTYTEIHGSWSVPDASTSTSGSADATWIGIGGSGSEDLIQIGTENLVENGQVVTDAFYEELPDYAQTITTVDVSPGDTVTANLAETTTGVWTMTLSDTTNGQSFSTTVNYSSANASAEWIEEAPSSASGILPLDNFGNVTFSDAGVTVGGQSESIAASGATAIGMENGAGELLTDTDALPSGGDGFTVTRTSASSQSSGSVSRREEPGGGRFRRGF